MSKADTHYDIAIIGAGIVGLFAAIVLSKRGFKIALSDAFKINQSAQQDNPLNVRSIALSLSSKQILQSFDCWQELQPYCQPILDIQVSSLGHWGVTRLNNKQQQCDALGYVVESHLISNVLYKKITTIKNIHLFEMAACQTLNNHQQGCDIELIKDDQPLNIKAKICLICDGAQSKTRDIAGFTTTSTNYHQTAIAAHVSGQHTLSNIAYERFTPEGPMAMLPLTNNRYGLVWTNSVTRSEQLMKLSDTDFLAELNREFGYRLGKINSIGNRVSFPLHKVISQQLVQNRCIVLGNSAHNLHPVAGQSLNLAIRDIAHLYDFFDSLDNCDDALGNYQTLRQKDHNQVVQLSDALINVFSNTLPILNHARSAALALLDVLPNTKNDFAWRGMGFAQTPASAQCGRIRNL